jgi:hypothetical protein
MARRIQDTLQDASQVIYDLAQRLGSIEAALREVNEDIHAGSREARLDGRKLPRDAVVKNDPTEWGYARLFVEHGGARLRGLRLTISEAAEAPAQVELVASTSFENLLQRVLDLFGRRTSRASKAEKARATAEYRRMLKDEPEVWHKPRTQQKAARHLTKFLGLPENAFQTIEDEVVIPEQRRVGLKDKK